MNRWLDEAFDAMNPFITWLASCAIAYVLVRLLVASVTGR